MLFTTKEVAERVGLKSTRGVLHRAKRLKVVPVVKSGMALWTEAQVRKLQEEKAMKTRAFNLIEILVSIAIIAVLLAILVPVLHGARVAARDTICRSNIRGIAGAASAYSAAHRMAIATSVEDLDIECGPATICPEDAPAGNDELFFSYVFLDRTGLDSRTVNALDALPRERQMYLSDNFVYRHGLRYGEKMSPDPDSAQWLRSWRFKGWMDGSVQAMRGPTSDSASLMLP